MALLTGHEDEVIDGYRRGISARSLAKRFGVGDQTIARLLDQHQIPRRVGHPIGPELMEARMPEPDVDIQAISQRPAELAYLAGLIDGEGCLMIYRKKDKRGTLHFRCNTGVANTSQRAIAWLQDRVGGSAHASKASRVGHLPVMHWRCEGPRMAHLLTAVRPYLVIKPELAGLLIEMQETLVYGSTGLGVPEEMKVRREVLFARYRAEREEMRGR
jgi:hypothetical protein